MLIRHQKYTLVSEYDETYAAYSRRWLEEFLPIMIPHEHTTNSNGCVIGLQVENEHIRKKIFQFGLDRHMEDLSSAARELGCTTPIFHNDPMELGSWAGGDDPEKSALTDIYGFDRYIIWCPRKYDKARPPRWETKDFAKSIAGTEERVRGFGGRALTSPLFLVELQGGWFNQWGHDHGFDEVYDYYGDEYTRTITESFMNEGSTMLSIYMYYGGTNWGSLGDPDVYTSYDYGACIREFGFLSDRLRKLRQTAYFARSFANLVARTDAIRPPRARCNRPDILSGQRQGPEGIQFFFLRNFNQDGHTDFQLTHEGVTARGAIEKRASFIAVGRLGVNRFFLELTSLPFIARLPAGEEETWVFAHNCGELIFRGNVVLEATTSTPDIATIAQEPGPQGEVLTRVQIQQPGTLRLKSETGTALTALILDERDALSLAVDFDTGRIAYGAYGLVFHKDRLLVETTDHATVKVMETRKPVASEHEFTGPVLPDISPEADLRLRDWARQDVQIASQAWKEIDIDSQADPMSHGFHSGHIAYRCLFETKEQAMDFTLNVRHRAVVWLNGKVLGGQITYGYNFMTPGAKNGPDLTWFGSEKYKLGEHLRQTGENELLILVESLGYNRGPFALADFRNPRGILHAKLRGRATNERWMISGVDVTARDEIFNTSGLPGEANALSDGAAWTACETPTVAPDTLTWYKARFDFEKRPDRRLPLRLHLEGPHCTHAYLNGMYLARYWGDFGPQNDFYLMDDFIRNGTNEIVFAVYSKAAGPFTAEIRPYRIHTSSGNIDEDGPAFATAKFEIEL